MLHSSSGNYNMSDEMKRLIETVETFMREPVQEAPAMNVADQLEDVYEEMMDLSRNLRRLINMIPDRSISERARRGPLAHIQMSLNHEHEWLGGINTTLSDIIEALRERTEEE